MYYSNVNCSCASSCSSHAGYPRPAPPPPGDCSSRGVERLPCSQGSSQCDCSLAYSPAAEISADSELYRSREGHLCAVPHPNGPHVRLEHRTGTPPPPPPPVVCASVYTLSPSPPRVGRRSATATHCLILAWGGRDSHVQSSAIVV